MNIQDADDPPNSLYNTDGYNVSNVDTYLHNAPIPECTFGNFAEAFGMALRYWLIEQTKHRIFNWYIKLVRYVVEREYEILAMDSDGEAEIRNNDEGTGDEG